MITLNHVKLRELHLRVTQRQCYNYANQAYSTGISLDGHDFLRPVKVRRRRAGCQGNRARKSVEKEIHESNARAKLSSRRNNSQYNSG